MTKNISVTTNSPLYQILAATVILASTIPLRTVNPRDCGGRFPTIFIITRIEEFPGFVSLSHLLTSHHTNFICTYLAACTQ